MLRLPRGVAFAVPSPFKKFGAPMSGSRLARAERSPQWRDGKFRNRRTRVDGPILHGVWQFAFGGAPNRKPGAPIPVDARVGADYRTPPASGLRVTWLGHSTTLLEIDGRRVLIDPVWSERASPVSFAGPKRFYPSPLPIGELPPLDVVLLSHDHADHLDPQAIRTLSARRARFVVPLGVGARLESWGVPASDIEELDWWEATTVAGLSLTATPARHFSGRGLTDRDTTLWAGWVIAGDRHRVYYSGDSALDDAFAEVGERFGPFDLTMIEIGAYDAMWADVHLGPEQAVRAHRLRAARRCSRCTGDCSTWRCTAGRSRSSALSRPRARRAYVSSRRGPASSPSRRRSERPSAGGRSSRGDLPPKRPYTPPASHT
jgi:L-ascorbate metabolism protein UlaG (beta-lactamase superfamily)